MAHSAKGGCSAACWKLAPEPNRKTSTGLWHLPWCQCSCRVNFSEHKTGERHTDISVPQRGVQLWTTCMDHSSAVTRESEECPQAGGLQRKRQKGMEKKLPLTAKEQVTRRRPPAWCVLHHSSRTYSGWALTYPTRPPV